MYKITKTDKAPAAIGPYSQAISFNEILFTSGQIPIDPKTGCVESDTIEGQTEQVMKNIGAILEASGSAFIKRILSVSRPEAVRRSESFQRAFSARQRPLP